MQIILDKTAGFCFGVKKAIEAAEKEINMGNEIYSLGDLVHNREEIVRLHNKGLRTISKDELAQLKNKTILFRAHGEPPESYNQLAQNGILLIDATCPVVIKLQERVRKSYIKMKEFEGNVLIFGKKDHAEVIGLLGQTNNEAIVFTQIDALDQVDFSKPVEVFSQTTMSLEEYESVTSAIKDKCLQNSQNHCIIHHTICGQVSRRVPTLRKLAEENDVIIFVSGKQSSNGKYLFGIAKSINQNSYWIESTSEIETEWFEKAGSVGISGATSTPPWQLEEVFAFVKSITI